MTLVDDGNPGGGLCILRGCIPSKVVLSAAERRYQARHDDRLQSDTTVDLERTVERTSDQIDEFAAHRRAAVDKMAERDDVEFIHDTARFVDDHIIAVGRDVTDVTDGPRGMIDEAGEYREIDGEYVVIATGSTTNPLGLPGIDDVDYWMSADTLYGTDFSDSGIVMGFGYVGTELVPYLSEAADMEITVIEHDDASLDEADPIFRRRLVDGRPIQVESDCEEAYRGDD